jgi:hypothetical protein
MKKNQKEPEDVPVQPQISKAEILKIEKELLRINPDIFKGIDPEKKHNIILTARSVILEKSHSGPLPDSQTLREYNEIIPNGGDRIMTVFEKQAAHRMEMENYVIREQMRQSNLGQIFALIIGIFIKGKDYQRKNLANKNS